MNEIGGYFPMSLDFGNNDFLHSNLLMLNTGRNALELILRRLHNVKRVWIPYYTCSVIIEPLDKLNIPYSFYRLNESLELKHIVNVVDSEYILYTNYFGVKGDYVTELKNIYKEQLIVDNSQANYNPPIGYTFYSPRKFFGLPDGGIAFIPGDSIGIDDFELDKSCDRLSHLLIRFEDSAEKGYEAFKANSVKLQGQPIRRMSLLTRTLLGNINFKKARGLRLKNFQYLHSQLKHINKFNFRNMSKSDVPMVYPFWTEDINLREKLLQHKIYVATYWPNVLDWCEENQLEYKFAKEIIPLPIDQRYDKEDMNNILNVIKQKFDYE